MRKLDTTLRYPIIIDLIHFNEVTYTELYYMLGGYPCTYSYHRRTPVIHGVGYDFFTKSSSQAAYAYMVNCTHEVLTMLNMRFNIEDRHIKLNE